MSTELDKKISVLISKLGLPSTQEARGIFASRISNSTSKSRRDTFIKSLIKKDMELFNALSGVSDDIDIIEKKLDILLNPETLDETVDFKDRTQSDPLYLFDEWDDFINGASEVGEIGKLGFSSAGGGTFGNVAAESRHPGIFNISTTNVANNICAIYLGGVGTDSVIMPADARRLIAILRLNGTITNAKTRFGLIESATAANPDGIYFEYTASTGNWHLVTQDAGVETRNTGPAAVSASWIKLELVLQEDLSAVDFFHNDVHVGTNSANIPSNAQNVAFAVETSTNAVRTTDIDFFRMISHQFPYNSRVT